MESDKKYIGDSCKLISKFNANSNIRFNQNLSSSLRDRTSHQGETYDLPKMHLFNSLRPMTAQINIQFILARHHWSKQNQNLTPSAINFGMWSNIPVTLRTNFQWSVETKDCVQKAKLVTALNSARRSRLKKKRLCFRNWLDFLYLEKRPHSVESFDSGKSWSTVHDQRTQQSFGLLYHHITRDEENRANPQSFLT